MAYIGRVPNVGNYFTLDAITTSSTATYNLLKGGVASLLKKKIKNKKYYIYLSLSDDEPWAQATVIIYYN